MPLFRRPAAGGGGGSIVDTAWHQVTAAELPNGVRNLFTVPHNYIAGSVCVFLNGQLINNSEVTEVGPIQVLLAFVPISSDYLQFMYRV